MCALQDKNKILNFFIDKIIINKFVEIKTKHGLNI